MTDNLNSPTLSRRIVLGAGVAILAPMAPAMAFQPAAADAELLRLCRKYQSLERAYERTCGVKDRVEQKDRAKQAERKSKEKPLPSRPVELTGTFDVWPNAYGPFGEISLEHERIREKLSEVANGTYTTFAFFLKGYGRHDASSVYPPESSRAKARELLAIYEDWEDKGGVPKPKRNRRSAALVRAEATLERLSNLQEAVAAAIAGLPAQTMAGIRAKLAAVAYNPDYKLAGDRYATDYPPLVAILESALRDIERINESATLTPLASKKHRGEFHA